MFGIKQFCSSSIVNNIRNTHRLTTSFIKLDDNFKQTMSNYMKENNIKHFTISVDYNSDNLDYTGIITTEYFTQDEIHKIANINELDYYIKMSNEFAKKN